MSEHIYEDSDMENERYHIIPFGSMHEEIVRCKDCRFRSLKSLKALMEEDGTLVASFLEENAYHCKLIDKIISISGFCKWGIRRVDEQIATGEGQTR